MPLTSTRGSRCRRLRLDRGRHRQRVVLLAGLQAHDEARGRAHRGLRRRIVHVELHFVQALVAHVADHADRWSATRHSRRRFGGVERRGLDALADRILSREERRRRALADQRDARRGRAILLHEQAAAQQRDAHRLEVIRRSALIVDDRIARWPFAKFPVVPRRWPTCPGRSNRAPSASDTPPPADCDFRHRRDLRKQLARSRSLTGSERAARLDLEPHHRVASEPEIEVLQRVEALHHQRRGDQRALRRGRPGSTSSDRARAIRTPAGNRAAAVVQRFRRDSARSRGESARPRTGASRSPWSRG